MISEIMCMDLLFYCLPCLIQEPTDRLSMNSESDSTHISFKALLIYAFFHTLVHLSVIPLLHSYSLVSLKYHFASLRVASKIPEEDC